VSPELKGIFGRLRARGIEVTLSTGRLPHWSAAVAEELGLDGYVICTEGGHVLHRLTREPVHYAALPPAVVHVVAQLAESDPAISLAGMGDDVIWATSDEAARRAHWWGRNCRRVADIREAPPPVLLVLFGPGDSTATAVSVLREVLGDNAGVVVHDAEDQGGYAHAKISSRQTDKGVGAEHLVRRLGRSLSEVLVFGDYLNDLGIMRRAGYSICPRGAHPQVMGLATRVSPWSAAEGFVARELRQLFGHI
jgi:hydroxymethylpyrimidine pyrophosphatase-like HAD family hydrolase